MIYVDEFDVKNVEELKEGLMESYPIVEAQRAEFMKSKYGNTLLIVTFDQEHIPYSIYIPGEKHDTRIQPFINKLMMCNNCQEYGHTVKRCIKAKVCRLCAGEGYG